MTRTFLIITFSSLVLFGCVSAPKGETAKVKSNVSYAESINLLMEVVNKCWVRGVAGPFAGDAILARPGREGNEFSVILGRDNSDIPFMPFAKIVVKTAPDGSVYFSVSEGDVFFTNKWEVDKSIRSWIDGSSECTNKKS
jgi:hypothetical protein